MIAKISSKTVILLIALVCMLANPARSNSKLDLQEKLSKAVKVKLSDVTIAEALEEIGKKADVKFVISDEAAWKLPNGEATRLSVILEGPLAESLPKMLNAFFMRYATGPNEVTIYPRPELEHVLGRPSAEQLELLKKVYTEPIGVYYLAEVQKTINEALGREVLIMPIRVQTQLETLLGQLVEKTEIYRYERDSRGRKIRVAMPVPKSEPNEPIPTEFLLPTPVTLSQLLSQVVAEEGRDTDDTTWYIPGMELSKQRPEIRVVDWRIFNTLKRAQRIDISYKNERVDKILLELVNRAGMELTIIPGSNLHEEKLSITMGNVTVPQVVGSIAEMVGAEYSLDIYGHMFIKRRKAARPKQTKEPASHGYVGKISIPMEDGKYYVEFMLRENDLTDELKKLRAEKMKDILGRK